MFLGKEKFMKESMIRIKKMERVLNFIQMETFIWAIFQQEKSMVVDVFSGLVYLQLEIHVHNS